MYREHLYVVVGVSVLEMGFGELEFTYLYNRFAMALYFLPHFEVPPIITSTTFSRNPFYIKKMSRRICKKRGIRTRYGCKLANKVRCPGGVDDLFE